VPVAAAPPPHPAHRLSPHPIDPASRRPYRGSIIEEHQNFGLKGGTLKVDLSPPSTLAFALTIESKQRWHEVHAQLYLEMGLDAAEYHANWGVV
jgi:hypothetical protein